MSQQQSSRRSTRAQNANTHPGLVAAAPKRRTHQQVLEANAAKAAAKEKQETKKRENFEKAAKRIADEEKRTDEREAADVTPRPAMRAYQSTHAANSEATRTHHLASASTRDDDEVATQPPTPPSRPPVDNRLLQRSHALWNVAGDGVQTKPKDVDVNMDHVDDDENEAEDIGMIYDDSPSGSEFPVPATDATETSTDHGTLEDSEVDERPKKKVKAVKKAAETKKPAGGKKPGNIGMRDAVNANRDQLSNLQDGRQPAAVQRPLPRPLSKKPADTLVPAAVDKRSSKSTVPVRSVSEEVDIVLAEMEAEEEERKRKRGGQGKKSKAKQRLEHEWEVYGDLIQNNDQASKSSKSGGKSGGISDHNAVDGNVRGQLIDAPAKARNSEKYAKDSYSGLNSEASKIAKLNKWASQVPPDARPAKPSTLPTVSRDAPTPALTADNSRTVNSSNRPASRSALSGFVQLAGGSKSNNRDIEEDGIIELGGISDRDETVGAEREAAIRSPPKGGRRLNSSALVKVEHVSPGKPLAKKANKGKSGSRPTNDDLPPALLQDNIWRQLVIPTLYRWAGAQKDPFVCGDQNTIRALEITITTYLGDVLERHIITSDAAFRIANQRLSEWRSVFGSVAVTALTTFYNSDREYDSDEARQEFANEALQDHRFVYRNATGNDKKRFKGLFSGALVLQVFAAHFTAMKGSKWLRGLYDLPDDEREIHQPPLPRAALALATAAVERALKLVASGAITIERIRASEDTGTALKFEPVVNPATGKSSTRHAAFSEASWGSSARQYLKSINRIDNIKMKHIMDAAQRFSKAAERLEDQMDVPETDDERGNLEEGSATSDEDYASD